MLTIRLEGAVAVLALDRPARRNALCSELVDALDTALREHDCDPSVRCILLMGAAPGFCAGSDLKELAASTVAQMSRHEARTALVVRGIAQLSKPVIAAVEGFAIGGGFCLATACDIVVTTAGCRWHLPEVAIGWIPPWGLELLVARVGLASARRLTWGDAPLDGAAALEEGLADFVAPEGQADEMAMSIAQRLARLPHPAVAATKRYYAARITAGAESGDAEANRLFLDNCGESVAQQTLRKYGVAA